MSHVESITRVGVKEAACFGLALSTTLVACIEPFALWALWHWIVRPPIIRDLMDLGTTIPNHPTPGSFPFFLSSIALIAVTIFVSVVAWSAACDYHELCEKLEIEYARKPKCPVCEKMSNA